MDFVRERDRGRAIGYSLCLSLTKSRKILLRYSGLFTSHLSKSSERFFYSLIIKKPITKYCTLAIVCHILFFSFSKYTCKHLHICYNDKLFNIQVGPRGAGLLPEGVIFLFYLYKYFLYLGCIILLR